MKERASQQIKPSRQQSRQPRPRPHPHPLNSSSSIQHKANKQIALELANVKLLKAGA